MENKLLVDLAFTVLGILDPLVMAALTLALLVGNTALYYRTGRDRWRASLSVTYWLFLTFYLLQHMGLVGFPVDRALVRVAILSLFINIAANQYHALRYSLRSRHDRIYQPDNSGRERNSRVDSPSQLSLSQSSGESGSISAHGGSDDKNP